MSSASHGVKPTGTRNRALEQELSEFAYVVSHDLSATFRHITGFSELLSQDGDAQFNPEQSSYIAQIHNAAEKCGAMLEQLLIYSRIQRRPLQIADCDLASMIDTVRLQLSGDIRQCGAKIVARATGHLQVDRELFTQALKCLLDNAIKFRRDGVPPRIEIVSVESAQECRIKISDNGIGTSSSEFERLFGMFYREHPQSGLPGTGAGLTIARRILRRHGGDVEFLDGRNGACVEIRLPRRKRNRGSQTG
jgi:signal transduction histidine kinase